MYLINILNINFYCIIGYNSKEVSQLKRNIVLFLFIAVFSSSLFSEDFAILVGINDYKYLNNLKYAEKDAEDLEQILLKKNYKVSLLTGAGIVKSTILEKIKDISRLSEKDDSLLFFFSGHGINGISESEKGLLTYYSDPGELSYILSQEELKTALSRFNGKKIIILDACFQGSRQKDLSTKPVYLDKKFSENFNFILTSSAGNQIANDGFYIGNLEIRNGVAAYYLIKALNGEADMNRDFCLTSEELEKYFVNYAQFVSGSNGQDIEVYFHSREEKIFILKLIEESPKTKQEMHKPAIGETEQNDMGENMVLVEGGKFTMGNYMLNYYDHIEDDEFPSHVVFLNYDFWIGKTEITFDDYETYCHDMGRNVPDDEGLGRGLHPVIKVSWWDAVGYCNWLSMKEGLSPAYDSSGNLLNILGRTTDDLSEVEGYRLPTEAEWEYAAKGGRKSDIFRYSGSSNIGEVAWYSGNSEMYTNSRSIDNFINYEVGLKKPNKLGIYDMSGNVFEWCTDFYDEFWYKKNNVLNPLNQIYSDSKIIRGGSTYSNEFGVEVADRHSTGFGGVYNDVGFRIARTSMRKSSYAEIEIPEFKKGKLYVESVPGNSKIYLNEIEYNSTPAALELDEGFYEIKLIKEGYETYRDYLYLKAGREFFFNAKLFEIQKEFTVMDYSPPEMVHVRGGSFIMGDNFGDSWIDCKPSFEVNLTYSYLIGKYEVTNAEFLKCINDTQSRAYADWQNTIGLNSKECDITLNSYGIFCLKKRVERKPVVEVNKFAAIGFCNWLSEKEGLAKAYDSDGNLVDGKGKITTDISKVEGYRLPTEAEWEYAARGGEFGSGFKYSGGNFPRDVGWYYQNSGDNYLPDIYDMTEVFMSNNVLHDVGTKQPNELGIFDMSGNVWEMCQDGYFLYDSESKTNPYTINSSNHLSKRGGGFLNQSSCLTVCWRFDNGIYGFSNDMGFRIARTDMDEMTMRKPMESSY